MSDLNHIFCMDVDYREGYAIVGGILFNDWTADEIELEKTIRVDDLQEFGPGEFHKREVPCLVELINRLEKVPSVFVVDGYVYSDAEKTHDLGGVLSEAFYGIVPVIGVAKNRFKSCVHASEVMRGESTKPLFVTSVGIEQDEACELVKSMHGEFRIPTLLRRVEQLARA